MICHHQKTSLISNPMSHLLLLKKAVMESFFYNYFYRHNESIGKRRNHYLSTYTLLAKLFCVLIILLSTNILRHHLVRVSYIRIVIGFCVNVTVCIKWVNFKNTQKFGHVVYGWPLSVTIFFSKDITYLKVLGKCIIYR